MTETRTRRPLRAGLAIGLAGLLGLAGAAAAQAHGYVGGPGSELTARVAMRANTGMGAAQYEPQSLEAPKGFPEAGPADGQIASAGGKFGGTLDEQSATRWVKNVITPGPHTISWTYTQAHATAKWHYYITKQNWDPDAPLTRSELEPLLTVPWDGTMPSSPTVQTIDVPADHSGYQVILAVWDVADTGNAFYNVIDVDIQGAGTTGTTE